MHGYLLRGTRQGGKEKHIGNSVNICDATLLLSQNHMADLGQGRCDFQFTDLHDSFGPAKTDTCLGFIIPLNSRPLTSLEPLVPPDVTAELTAILFTLILGDNKIRSKLVSSFSLQHQIN